MGGGPQADWFSLFTFMLSAGVLYVGVKTRFDFSRRIIKVKKMLI
jgi:hypothetical protein